MKTYAYKIKSTIKGEHAEKYDEQDLISFYNNRRKNPLRHVKLLITGDQYDKKHNDGSIDSFYYCHNYALKVDYIETCEQGLQMLCREYDRIPLSQLKRGDIVTFFDYNRDINSDNIQHFAIVKRTENTLKSTIIISKWGLWGIFETNLYSLPDFYGSKVCFWRKRGEK
jgi:hypothetical protein